MPARRSVFHRQGAGLLVMEVFADPTLDLARVTQTDGPWRTIQRVAVEAFE
jgi:hypothetical protein